MSPYLMVFLNSTTIVVFEISGCPKFTLGDPVPPGCYVAAKIFVPEPSTLLMVF